MARFGGTDGRLNRFKITQLTHQNHIRILPQRALDCLRKTRHIGPNFALRHDAFFMRVIIFDGILNRNNMRITILINIIYHRR